MTNFMRSRWMRRAATAFIVLAAPALLCAREGKSPAPKKDAAAAKVELKPFISLAPSVVMLQGKAGQSFQRTLQMTNGTPIPLTFRMVAMDVAVKNGKRVFGPAGEMPGSIAATAVFSVPQITIPPHKAGKVNVTLTVPPQSPIRAVVVEFRGMDPIATSLRTKAKATASLGALVTFSLAKNVEIDASALEIKDQTPTINASITAWLRNSGSDPGLIKGAAAVLTRSGRLFAKANIPEERLLPGERLPFKAELPVELQPGRYRAFATFLCNGKTITETANFEIR